MKHIEHLTLRLKALLVSTLQRTVCERTNPVSNASAFQHNPSIALLYATVVKDKIRMKALRDGPGYMQDAIGRFEVLKTGKAVVLKVGDTVVFRMREGKQGGHLGIYRIEEETQQTKGFFSIILGC